MPFFIILGFFGVGGFCYKLGKARGRLEEKDFQKLTAVQSAAMIAEAMAKKRGAFLPIGPTRPPEVGLA